MSNDARLDQYRRRFLGGAATAVTGLALAPGVMLHQVAHARPADQPVSSDVRWGMLIDTNKCGNGCNACVTACDEEHGLTGHGRPESDAQWIRKVSLTDPQSGHKRFLPMMCQHCENPPCVDVCPTGASFKRADGIVLVNKHTCIGCRYCMMACPYKARSFIHEKLDNQRPHAPRGKGTVESCTLCVHRIDRDGSNAVPACAEAVNREGRKAILFGDLNDPDSEISRRLRELGSLRLRADMGLDPAVSYSGI